MRREEELDMRRIHSRLFLALFCTLLFLVMAGLCGCGGGGSDSSTPVPKDAPKLVSLTIAPTSATIVSGAGSPFSVKGKYSDDSIVDLTNQDIWHQKTISGATITNIVVNGVVTIYSSSGSITEITAVKDGITSNTATLTVQ
jgi:hypothetical protein